LLFSLSNLNNVNLVQLIDDGRHFYHTSVPALRHLSDKIQKSGSNGYLSKLYVYDNGDIIFHFINIIFKIFDLIFTVTLGVIWAPVSLVPIFAVKIDGLGAYLGYDFSVITVSYKKRVPY
jgi:hypothetical protein